MRRILYERVLSLFGVMPSTNIARLLKELACAKRKSSLTYVRSLKEITKELDLFDKGMVNLVNR